jgi:hypothetical protein
MYIIEKVGKGENKSALRSNVRERKMPPWNHDCKKVSISVQFDFRSIEMFVI